jgi:hypothetical protein
MPTTIDEIDKTTAMFIAAIVRNAMEDFHCKYLSNKQMKELNPIIRNAIATALHILRHSQTNEAAKKAMEFSFGCIPDYWEEPELLDDFKKLQAKFEDDADEKGCGAETT